MQTFVEVLPNIASTKHFLKILWNLQRETCGRVSFLNHSATLKEDSGKSVFLWILKFLKNNFFMPLGHCSCSLKNHSESIQNLPLELCYHNLKTPAKKFVLQPNLCITTTWGTKFQWSLQTGGCYKEDLCITTKIANSDIWSLYKGSIVFHLITHDTDRFSWKRKNKQVSEWYSITNTLTHTLSQCLKQFFRVTTTKYQVDMDFGRTCL